VRSSAPSCPLALLTGCLLSGCLLSGCITVRDVAREETSRTLTASERGVVRAASPPDLEVRFVEADSKQVTLEVSGTQRCAATRRDFISVEGTVERELMGWEPHLWIGGGFVAAGGLVALGASFLELRIAREAGWAAGGALASVSVLELAYVGVMSLFALDGTWEATHIEPQSSEEDCDPVERGMTVFLELSPAHTASAAVGADGRVSLPLPAPGALVPSPPDAIPLTPMLITAFAAPKKGAAAQFEVPAQLREAAPVILLYEEASARAAEQKSAVLAAWQAKNAKTFARLQADSKRLSAGVLGVREERLALEKLAHDERTDARRALVEHYGAVLVDLTRYSAALVEVQLPALRSLPGLDPRLASLEAATSLVEDMRAEQTRLRDEEGLGLALAASYVPCGEQSARRRRAAVRARRSRRSCTRAKRYARACRRSATPAPRGRTQRPAPARASERRGSAAPPRGSQRRCSTWNSRSWSSCGVTPAARRACAISSKRWSRRAATRLRTATLSAATWSRSPRRQPLSPRLTTTADERGRGSSARSPDRPPRAPPPRGHSRGSR